jgi:hypothetical protein
VWRAAPRRIFWWGRASPAGQSATASVRFPLSAAPPGFCGVGGAELGAPAGSMPEFGGRRPRCHRRPRRRCRRQLDRQCLGAWGHHWDRVKRHWYEVVFPRVLEALQDVARGEEAKGSRPLAAAPGGLKHRRRRVCARRGRLCLQPRQLALRRVRAGRVEEVGVGSVPSSGISSRLRAP